MTADFLAGVLTGAVASLGLAVLIPVGLALFAHWLMKRNPF